MLDYPGHSLEIRQDTSERNWGCSDRCHIATLDLEGKTILSQGIEGGAEEWLVLLEVEQIFGP